MTAQNTATGSATVSAGGLYSVTVTASGCSATTTVTVSEDKAAPGSPTLTASNSGTLTCAVPSLTLTASATGTGLTYAFARVGGGAGLLSSNPSAGTAVVNAAGTYSVTVTGGNGCTVSQSTTVFSNNATPTVSISPLSGTLTCTNPSLTLTATASVTALLWSTGATSTSIVVTAGGTYSVTATAPNGCSAVSNSVLISEDKTPPTPTLTASSTAVCQPNTITLTAGGGTSYTFSAGATPISANQATVAQTGTYSVTVATANGCTSTTSIAVQVNDNPPAPTLSGLSREVSQSVTPLSLLPFVVATGSNTLSFSGVNGALNPPNADVSQLGVQTFLVTQTNASGCVSPATPFSLTVVPAIPATQTVCRSSQVILTSNTPGTRYEWYKNGTSAPFKLTEIASIQRGTSTASLTIVSQQTSATYYLKVFQANGSFVFEGPFAVTVNYSCIAPSARQAASEHPEVPLVITLTPNPIIDGHVRAIVQGAAGLPLTVTLLDLQGRTVGQQVWPTAEAGQFVDLPIVTQPSGLYLLQAQTPNQLKTIKVIK